MPTSNVFGRVDKPEQLNLEPFKFTLVGYRHLDSETEEVTYEFTASGVQPFGKQINMVRVTGEDGRMGGAAVIDYIETSLVSDEERVRFREALDEPDVYFDGEVLGQIGLWLLETYSDRPTQPRTARRSGQSRGGRRSTAAANGKG